MVAMVIEVLIVKPIPYELYAMTWHGFFLGMIAFFFGYTLAASEIKWMWITLAVAVGLTVLRLSGNSYLWLTPVESVSWILTVLSLANKYLNKESKALRYLSEAAYPIYIVHLLFQNLVSALIFPLDIAVPIKFLLLVVLTLTGCLVTYEIIKRMNVTRFLFGLKPVRP
jgi:glucan biosynthesis protein C